VCIDIIWCELYVNGLLQCVYMYVRVCYPSSVCCSVLQCVAVCCSVLQFVAVCCSVYTYVYQCVLSVISLLQCVAVCIHICIGACCLS